MVAENECCISAFGMSCSARDRLLVGACVRAWACVCVCVYVFVRVRLV